jgi:tripartite-type tricarboxylate transporter receptor subunit TctC
LKPSFGASLLAIGLALACAVAQAAYPERPIRVIVPYGPGGSDVQMRMVAPEISKLLGGQPIVVENRPGGGATVGTLAVRNSPADGYTLLYTGTAPLTVSPHMRPLAYKLDDFAPIGNITATALLVVARADAPYKTINELIEYAKANPTKVNFASSGTGTTTHIVGEVLQIAAGIKFTHVPHTSAAQQMASLLGGSSDVVIGIPTTWMPQINTGKLRGLASTGQKRSPFLPNAPSLKGELGLDVLEETKFGLLAPKGVPADIINALTKALQAVVTGEEFQSKMRSGFTTPLYLNPAEFAAALAQEDKYWRAMMARPEFKALKE